MHGTFGESALEVLPPPSVSPAAKPSPAPLVLEQAPEGRGRLVLLVLLVPLLAALLAPFWLVGAHVIAEPAARAILAERPLVAVQLGLGLLVLISIFGLPLAHLALSAFVRRRVTIDRGLVHSEAVGSFGRRVRVEPLAQYAGLVHRVRTSLSGVHHELVLVHRRRSRSVVLMSAQQIPQETVDAAARLFALAEIPSREAVSVTPLRGSFRPAEPSPSLATVSL